MSRLRSMWGQQTSDKSPWNGMIIYRRDHTHTWLRPYDDFIVGTWSFYINRVNKRRKKKYGTTTN